MAECMLEETDSKLETWDFVVIAVYFVIVLIVGLVSGFRSARGTVSGYFLAGQDMNWILVGATLFASNIGSGHFVGLAGSAASSGIAVAGFELNAMFTLVILGWLFAPVYISAGVYTMPEYIKKRFGGRRIRVFLSILSLVLYIFTKISVDLFAGAIFITESMPDVGVYPAIVLLLIIATIFTATGGLTAVIWTDAAQVVIMLGGATVLMFKSFSYVGGFQALLDNYHTSLPCPKVTIANESSCAGVPPQSAPDLLRDVGDAEYPWTGMTFGLTVNAVWYWCADQVIVQRALAAKNYTHVKLGCVFAGWLKMFPLWLIIFPGMAARIIFPEAIGCTDPDECDRICNQPKGCSNIAYPRMVLKLLETPLKGLMLSVMLSALMSSLTSVFNSSSTIFTMDIWRMIRKKASDLELLVVGRLFVVLLAVVSVAWIPIIQSFQNPQLFNYIQSVTSYLGAPICALYCMAIFVPRTNEPGAFWGMSIGLTLGVAEFIAVVAFGSPNCNEADDRPFIVQPSKMNYLHFGLLLFVVTCVVIFAVSLVTEPIAKENTERLTFWTRNSAKDRVSLADVAELKRQNKRMVGQINEAFNNNDVFTVDDVHGGAVRTAAGRGHQPPSTWRTLLNCVCGITNGGADEDDSGGAEMSISLKEHPFWGAVANFNAILLMAGGVFVYTFFV